MNKIIASGPKKSGCSLFLRLLDSHPQVSVVTDESYLLEHVYKYMDNEELFKDIFACFDTDELLCSIREREMIEPIDGIYKQHIPFEYKQRIRFCPKTFRRYLKSLIFYQHYTVRNIVEHILYSWMAARGRSRNTVAIASGDFGRSLIVADKYLENVIPVLYIRNPYYALNSLKKARTLPVSKGKELHPVNFMEVILEYKFLMDNINSFPRNTHIIKFEDMVVDTGKTMRAFCKIAGIDYHKTITKPTIDGEPHWGTSSFDLKSKGIHPEAVHRKITELSSMEIALITKHLKPFLDRFGYYYEPTEPAAQ
jgi:hypothetical protein